MTHEELRILISAYIDGEVNPSEKNIVEEHLSSCSSCQKEYKAYMAISSSLSKWTNQSLSPDEEIKIQKGFQQRREPMFTKRTVVGLTTTLALAVIIGSVIQTQNFRGVQGRLKSSSDNIGDQFTTGRVLQARMRDASVVLAKGSSSVQYEPYYMKSDYDVSRRSVGDKRLDSGSTGKYVLATAEGSYRARAVGGAETMAYIEAPASVINPTTPVSTPIVLNDQEYRGFPERKMLSEESFREQKLEGNTASYDRIYENPFLSSKDNPLSTFSIDVDTASYSNVRHFLMNGQMPPKDSVRIEEMINYFHYDYPQPKWNDPFSITTELSP
ncbi:MAG: von Willebrand factor type A domain-containing protein, partial [Candidatus Omnitrophota bacterium]